MAYYDELTFSTDQYISADELDYSTPAKLHDIELSEDPYFEVDDIDFMRGIYNEI